MKASPLISFVDSAKYTNLRLKCYVNEKLRNEKNYERDLELNESSQTGIKEDCIFHKLENFHVTKNKTVDPMHDILEGICRTEMTNIVLNFLKGPTKYFSLKT